MFSNNLGPRGPIRRAAFWLELLVSKINQMVSYMFVRYVTKNFDKWENLGVPHNKPSFPCGTLDLMSKRHFSDLVLDDYNQFRYEFVKK